MPSPFSVDCVENLASVGVAPRCWSYAPRCMSDVSSFKHGGKTYKKLVCLLLRLKSVCHTEAKRLTQPKDSWAIREE